MTSAPGASTAFSEYYDRFAEALAGSSAEDVVLGRWLHEQIERITPRDLFVDVGPGDGVRFTAPTLRRFRRGIAVEPDAELCRRLRESLPGLDVIQQPIRDIDPEALGRPILIQMIHVLYCEPWDADFWWDILRGCFDRLAPGGALLVVLQAPESGMNRLHQHFTGYLFDLPAVLQRFAAERPGARVEITNLDAPKIVPDRATACAIARLMISYKDLPSSPGDDDLAAYVDAAFHRPAEGRYVMHDATTAAAVWKMA